MIRFTLLVLFLTLYSCKAAEPELVNIFAGSDSSVISDPGKKGQGRITVGSDSQIHPTPSGLKVRSRVAAAPQNSVVQTTNYRVRGQVEL